VQSRFLKNGDEVAHLAQSNSVYGPAGLASLVGALLVATREYK
jgi:hypothetical protein